MNSRLASSTSIRRRLLIFLLPPLTALMLVVVYVDYRAAMLFARTTFDQRLTDTALTVATRVTIESGELHAQTLAQSPPTSGIDRDNDFQYSIEAPNGNLLAGDPDLAAAPRGGSNPSYADIRLGGQILRVATYRLSTNAGVVTINVAGINDSRTGPAHFILGSTWLIGFIQLDTTLLLVWIGVHFGLKPLLVVRGQIESRSARELRPLDVSAVPTEVRPLVDALNLLFEMLEEAARAQRQFVADTAHQLRTPITGLLGHLEVMMREPDAEPLHGRLAALHDGMSRLAAAANQLLTLARADPSASLADKVEGVDLKSLVERVLERNIDRSVESGLDIGAEARRANVTGSPRLLDDLLGNLVDNALHYTPAGGHITIRCGLDDEIVYLEVEDDGPGIPESERVHVRQRFYRLPGSPGRGCGLGLAIVDEIARLHRADLTIVDGANGRGTKVSVRFPAAGGPPRPNAEALRREETETRVSSQGNSDQWMSIRSWSSDSRKLAGVPLAPLNPPPVFEGSGAKAGIQRHS
ncbi:MAG: sensor histidine kinase [Gammaproteobacteria bacterium]|jgi:two-component system sensor histidine kinase TctE|nr:sensor histidine kinase [Gammaproteobacteria bacterium]